MNSFSRIRAVALSSYTTDRRHDHCLLSVTVNVNIPIVISMGQRQSKEFPENMFPDEIWMKFIFPHLRGIDIWRFRSVCHWWSVELPQFITEMTPFKGTAKDLRILKRICPNIERMSLHTSFLDGDIHPIDQLSARGLHRTNLTYEVDLLPSGLTYLDFGPVFNIRGIALWYLSGLRTLKLGQNTRISDTDIFRLTNLEVLDVGANSHISDTAIISMTSLRILGTRSGGRITCRGLRRMSNLEIVRPSTIWNFGSAIALDADVLMTAMNLRECKIADDSIQDIHLRNCTKLRKLTIIKFSRNLDSGLCFLTNLTELSITECDTITDLSIGSLTTLTSLSISHSSGVSDSSIRLLTALQSLEIIHNNSISDDSIDCLTNLTYLAIEENTRITDSSVAKLPLLDCLDLDLPLTCNISPGTEKMINSRHS